jgi:hypothetical protein
MTGSPEMTAAASAPPQGTRLYVYGVVPAADARGWPGTDGIDGQGDGQRLVGDRRRAQPRLGRLAAENRRLRERLDHLERELASAGARAAGHAREGQDG